MKDRGRILLVDDEERIVDFVRDALEDDGFSVLTASDGEEAIDAARRGAPDLILLDIMMPKCDGYTVCRVLREETDAPILLLSAKQSETDRVLGFGMGADDYVMKPFSVRELVARIEAHLRRERRRNYGREDLALLRFGELVVDLGGREVRFRGAAARMTRKEFDVVELLALNPGQVFSKDRIYERVWNLDPRNSSGTVTEHVKRVRKKLEALDPATSYVSTVWSVGYKWDPSPAS
jgi:DNA-binding response OmpR family regulator